MTRRRRVVVGAVGVALGALLTIERPRRVVGDAPAARPVARPRQRHADRLRARRAGAARLHRGRRRRRRDLAAAVGVLEDIFGTLKMDFSTWIASGLMVVVGAVWTIVYNADLVLALRHGGLRPDRPGGTRRPRRRRLPARRPVPHRHHARDVHARRLHPRHGHRDHRLVPRRREPARPHGRRLRRPRGHRSGAPDRRHLLARVRNVPGLAARDVVAVGSQSILARRGEAAGDDATVRGDRAPRPRRRLPRAHDLRDRRLRPRLHDDGAGVAGAPARTPGSPSSTASSCRAGTTSTSAAARSDFRLSGFYFDEPKPFAPIPVAVRDPQTGRELRAHGDRRPQRDRSAGRWSGSRPRRRRSPPRSRADAHRRSTTSPSPPASIPTRRPRASSRRSSRTGWRPSRSARSSTTRRRRRSRSTG